MIKISKTLTALAVAATIGIAAVAAPQPAEARGGRIAAGFIGGLAAGAVIGSAYYGPYYGPGYYYGPHYYYGRHYYYGPRRVYYRVSGCHWSHRRVWDGQHWHHARVC